MEKTKIDDTMRLTLMESFPDEAYSQHPTKTFLTTLKAMYVTERLNDVFGIGRWTIHTEVVERTNDYVLVKGKFESLDYDVIVPEQYGGHKTSGKNTEIADGYKSAITDCQSKIASYLEIGIDMFKGKINPPKKMEKQTPPQQNNDKPWLNPNTEEWQGAVKYLSDGGTIDKIEKKYRIAKDKKEQLKSEAL